MMSLFVAFIEVQAEFLLLTRETLQHICYKIVANILICPVYLPVCLVLNVLWFDSEMYSLNLKVV